MRICRSAALILLFLLGASFCRAAGALQETRVRSPLQLAVRFYQEGNYQESLDRFMDILMTGTSQERSVANDYINRITRRVNASESNTDNMDSYFPPEDDENPPARLTGKSGIAKPAVVTTESKGGSPAVYASGPRDEKTREAGKKPPSAAGEKKGESEKRPSVPETSPAASAQARESAKQKTEAELFSAAGMAPALEAADSYGGDEARRKADMAAQIERKLKAIRDSMVAYLSRSEGVQIIMNGDIPEAVNIDPETIFSSTATFKPNADVRLSAVAGLMFAMGKANFTVTPFGFSAGDNEIVDMRRAIAMQSYFLQKGVSAARLTLDLDAFSREGLPRKFRELGGVGVIFDYGRKPALRSPSDASEHVPLAMTLGVFPSAFEPDRGQGAIIELSALDTSVRVDKWRVQIYRYDPSRTLSVVQESSGSGPAYHQIYWNGRRNFFGRTLPYGKYLCLLSALGSDGRERSLRQAITLIPPKGWKGAQDGVPSAKKSGAPAASGLVYSMPFGKGTARLAPGSAAIAARLAGALEADKRLSATVTGYAAASEPKAAALAKKRAAAVAKLLSAKYGIDSARVRTAVKIVKKTKPLAVAALSR